LFFRQLRNSGLIFYDSIANKNVTISSYELSQLNFVGTSLAVLGTCYSANGELTIDGVAGLQYGFKSAGVRSLIMSLWDADDASTSYFMQTFYASLVRGQTIKQSYDEALTETKIKFESPYYWAGFILLE
jgi:CHAT domain-containing protein